MRRPRLASKVWLNVSKETSRYFKLVTFLFSKADFSADVKILLLRIHKLNKKSGSNFAFLYLKECVRLIIRFLAGSGELRFSKGIFVARDSLGLPKLLPLNLRQLIEKKDNLGIRFVLTLLNIYRVGPSVQRIKMGSITEPFTGVTRTLDENLIHRAMAELVGKDPLKLKNMKFIKLETASPTAGLSCGSSASDILGLVYNPQKFIALLKFMVLSPSNVLIFVGVLFIAIVSVPYLIILYLLSLLPLPRIKRRTSEDVPFGFDGEYQTFDYTFRFLKFLINELTLCMTFGHFVGFAKESLWAYQGGHVPVPQKKDLPLGRLSVVYDQAGKARVVAITNYFIQVGLYPLHKALFDRLGDLEQDGTFDQMKPLNVLISKESNEQYHSFDLSAATDRLPIDIQIQVLNYFGHNLGNRGASLLDISGLSPNKKYEVRYAVGQPMGAYSSGAMLALTHHVIVRCSALRCGIESFSDYALLGDDIVIRNNLVASEYLKLMTLLGVEINLSKSVISNDFAEFAKVGRGRACDYTPLGSGLLLRYLRDYNYLGVVLNELFRTRVFTHYGAFLKILGSLKAPSETLVLLALGSVFGHKGAMGAKNKSDVDYLKRSIGDVLSSARPMDFINNMYQTNLAGKLRKRMPSSYSEDMWPSWEYNRNLTMLWSSIRMLKGDIVNENLGKIFIGFRTLMSSLFRVTSKHGSLGVFERLTRLLTPGFYVYFIFLVKDLISFIDDYAKLGGKSEYKVDGNELDDFMDLMPIVTDLNGLDRKSVADFVKFQRRMRFYFSYLKQNRIFDPVHVDFVTLKEQQKWDGNNLKKGVPLPKSFCKLPKPFKDPKVLGLPMPLALKPRKVKTYKRGR